MHNARLDEAKAGIKIARRNISNLKYSDDTTLMAESKEELKSFLMKMKEESENSWLKTQHSEKIMASGPFISWQKSKNQCKQCQTLFSWALKSLQP